ncbi:hypothetical protein CVU82_03735 [Candidatus Falkowbacteria bacterium HGW-Falkowbacteria-1]|uniref:Bacterial repeat domain-containing protein n=1 Tax=Candidatus Falkowbacteria bacterium HGW-Falkowbacteria-1 TaxID=2013768 RepID=A0A2N2E8V6_9BACT|nr:MAG: hypothetical protein CVU82_03735 [Candidatus Falkowbacteria bacterium HGW-Falkowbacteria-1]
MFKTKQKALPREREAFLRGFTLIELLVVIAIIGILATLELFFNENGRYPTTDEWNSGSITSSTTGEIFMYNIPTAPSPADGDCLEASNTYSYIPQNSGASYTIDFCTGKQISDMPEGAKRVTPGGVVAVSGETDGGVVDVFFLNYTADVGGIIMGNINQTVNRGEDGSPVEAQANLGYSFFQWSDGMVAAFRMDSNVQENTNVTAQFIANTYTLSFNAQGGGVSPSSKLVVYNQEVEELPIPTRNGYVFQGWDTESDGSGDNYVSNTIYSIAGDLTVYALWEEEVFVCGNNVTFDYNGGVVTYGTVEKDYGGGNIKCWLDRNLGASQVCAAYNDPVCYGDLFQWGRGADGHQLRTSVTTTTPSSVDSPGHNNFIKAVINVNNEDWRVPQKNSLWQGVSGINNPCPDGWRVPTSNELDIERLSWASNNPSGAMASVLKWPAAGSRTFSNGSFYEVGVAGYVWSSTVYNKYAYLLYCPSNAYINYAYRAGGRSVRCIKD